MIKKAFAIIIVALIGISLALPTTSEARGWRGGWGWYGPAAFGGGLLLGAALARPYYYAPVPVYAYPPPAPVYAAPPPPVYYPNQAYAYPDPAVAPMTENRPSQPGLWVEVPGQSINGKWVPPHKAWVPDNP
jgi:hypothetical protein